MKKINNFFLLLAVCFCSLAVQAKSVGGPVIPLGEQQHGGTGGDAFSRWVLGEPGAPPAPPPTSVCINEIDSDTPGIDAAEFIELSGTPNGSLDHFVVVLFNGANDLSYRAYDLDGLSLDANGFFLIGNSGVAGVDLVIPNNTIQNGADAVAIYDTASFVILSFTTTINLVDAIVYDTDDADDNGLLVGLGQSVQYNENENGLVDTQSVSRSTDCGSSIVAQDITPDASNGMNNCPSFPGAPDNVSITNSTCNPSCVAAGGLITAPTGSPCPTGSTLQYQVNSGSWSSNLPIYDQEGPAQSIKTRCSCDADDTMNSAESGAKTTSPANCTDNTLPTITCPGNIAVANTSGLCSAVVSYNTPVGTDNCSGPTTIQTLGLPSGASYPVGATTNIFKVTDASGNTATCAFAVSVTDTQLPTITCPGNIAVANASGLCSAIVSYTTPSGTDNCSGATTIQTLGLPSGASYPVGATTNIFKVTDGTGNTATCAFAVSVTDTQLPTITCPGNIAVANASGLCSAIVSYTTPSGTDNCSGAATIQTLGLPSGASYPVGATTNIFKVTDGTGNTATCAFAVSVTDTQLPTITCPGNIAVANASGLCSAIVSYTTPSGTDNCSGPTTIQTLGLPSGASYPVGATTNIFKVTDGTGNTATCAFAVSVTDTQLPTITCPGNIAVANTSGLCSAIVSYTTPSGTDNCSGPTTIQTLGLPSGASYPVGATTNIFKVTDGTGNTATCAFAVSVTDTQLPTITCPGNIAVANASGLCSAIVSYTSPSGTDNCSGAATIQTLGLPSGASYPVGATTNIFKVTDGTGNTATCAFAVSVTDTQLPTITCPGNIAVANTSGLCSAIVSYTTPSGTDNCSGAATIQTLGLPSGASYPVGATTNIFKVTDGTGNIATCAFAVSVTDTQLPTITCPGNIAVANASGLCSAIVSYTTPSGTDNCSGASTIQTLGLPSGASYPVGATTNIFKVTDGTGNTATCAFAVSVTDTQLPTITCPGNIAVANASGLCSAIVSYTSPSGTDNCSGAATIQTLGLPSGASYPVGATTNIFKVTDGTGNTATCAFAVSVTDTQLPTITCPGNIAVANASGLCSAIVSYTSPSGTDNCSGAATIQTLGLPSGASYPVGATTNIFKVTDGTGNTATCAFAVSVTDTQLPTITCPGNIAVANASGLCSAIVSYTTPSGTDNCSGPTTIQTLGLPSGASYPVGATTNIFKVTDGTGNTATCAFAVSVTDTQLPTITCPGNIAVANASGLCSAIVSYTTPSGTDNCSGAGTIQTLGLPSGASFPVGVTTNTFKVTDGANNTATCAFTITVTDTQLPTLLCKNVTLNLNATGQATLTIAQVNNGSFDNCGIVAFGLSQTIFSCANVGNNNVTLSGRDQGFNQGQCTAVVTVIDPILPVAKCKNLTANLGSNGTVTVAASTVDNGSSDNCNFTLLLTPNTFTCSNIGLHTVTLKATDGGGNTATCTAQVTVKDLTGPTAKCKNPTIFLDNTGHVTLTAAQVNNGSSDNCGIALMNIDKTSFNCSEISGTQPVILSITDGTGNSSTCLSNVTVKDGIAPTPICENVTVSLDANGKAIVYGADLAIESTDNCSVWSYTPIAKVYTAANLGNNNLTISVKDWSGNSTTCVSIVTVEPYNPPANQPASGGKPSSSVFDVYPNPSTGDVFVAFELPAEQLMTFQVYDLHGRMVLHHETIGLKGENTQPLRLEGIAPGVYMLYFESAGWRVMTKLVVQGL